MIKSMLEQEYTMWAAFLGSTFVTLATHGTDQDMVQRMLTAKNKRQSAVATILSGLADIPITLVGADHRHPALCLLPAASRIRRCRMAANGVVPPTQGFPVFRPHRHARRPARTGHRRRAGHRDGIAEHGAEFTGHQLRARLPFPLVRRAARPKQGKVRVLRIRHRPVRGAAHRGRPSARRG